MRAGTIARVAVLPDCDICVHVKETGTPNKAVADVKTKPRGQWGYVCEEHIEEYRWYPDFGTGKGQKLELIEAGS